MKVLKILTAPNPLLDTPSQPVQKIDEKIKKLVADMEATLVAQTDPQGVGLAAIQVGTLLRLFIMKQSPRAKTTVYINPKVVKEFSINSNDNNAGGRVGGIPTARYEASTGGKENEDRTRGQSKEKKSSLEGCLSIPRIWSPVSRDKTITISYQDLQDVDHTATFTKLPAIIVQHELDHLDGTLFTKRAIEQKSILYEEINGELVKMKY